MDKNKKILIVGVAILVVVGLVIAANAAVNATKFMEKRGINGFYKTGCIQTGIPRHMLKRPLLEGLGLPENASKEQIRDAMWDEELKDLGLTEDSTLREYRQALDAKLKAEQENKSLEQEQRAQEIREKVGLPENATQEDIMNAMKQWREENKDMFPKQGRSSSLHDFEGPVRGGCGKGM